MSWKIIRKHTLFITFAEPLLLKQQIKKKSGTVHLHIFTKSADGPPFTIKETLLGKHDTNIFIFIQSSGTTCRHLFISLYFS